MTVSLHYDSSLFLGKAIYLKGVGGLRETFLCHFLSAMSTIRGLFKLCQEQSRFTEISYKSLILDHSRNYFNLVQKNLLSETNFVKTNLFTTKQPKLSIKRLFWKIQQLLRRRHKSKPTIFLVIISFPQVRQRT